MSSTEPHLGKRKATTMLERVGGAHDFDVIANDDADDDRLFRPWKTSRLPAAELVFVFKNGNSRSMPYSDQKGVWHGGDTIIVKYAEESVWFVIIRGQNIRELARAIAVRSVDWIEELDEARADAVERRREFVGKNVFEIRLVKRRWGDECQYDAFFDEPETM